MSTRQASFTQPLNFRAAPRTRDRSPSRFVLDCLRHVPSVHGNFALDLGCGIGRHARLLQSLGYSVLAIDADPNALQIVRRIGTRSKLRSAGKAYPILADGKGRLPLRDGGLHLALAVHFPIQYNLAAVTAALSPGGFLIFESFGNRGMNWIELPRTGQLRSQLENDFDILKLDERAAGPKNRRAVTVRLFARKCAERPPLRQRIIRLL